MLTLGHEISTLFLEYSCRKLESMAGNLGVCLSRLTDAQRWERHGDHENAVGNLVLHLCGNMRQWSSPAWVEIWMFATETRMEEWARRS